MFYYPRDDDFGKKRDKVDWISWISTNYAVFIFSLQTSAEIFENLWSPDIANKAAATRGYHDFDDCCLLSTLSRTDVIKHLQFWIGISIGNTFFQSIFFFDNKRMEKMENEKGPFCDVCHHQNDLGKKRIWEFHCQWIFVRKKNLP